MSPDGPIEIEHAAVVYPTIATAGVIHDLGNLIQIASSAIGIVTRTPEMPAIHSGSMLLRAQTSLEHAGALIRQTMNIMRNRPTVDDCSSIAICLADVIALIGGMDETEPFFDLDIEPGMPDVPCNASALRSVILNLVLNAREAITGSGVIEIRGRAISRGKIVIGAELSIADNGIGMSPAAIACAFDPFFTTKCDGLGGVGLPMVERFVRDVGGEISIESEQGVGTTVILRLPASALIVSEG